MWIFTMDGLNLINLDHVAVIHLHENKFSEFSVVAEINGREDVFHTIKKGTRTQCLDFMKSIKKGERCN